MNEGRTVFSQLMDFLPLHQFRHCVERYAGNYKIQSFTCLDQFLCLAFAQLTFRESLRDIEACLRAQQPKLYHMGFRGAISRSNLGHANEHRDWRIYADFAQVLIGTARDLYRDEPFGVELSETVYALDSTTIDLCLSLFPWGKFRRRKSAVKLHTLLDLRGSIPTNVYVTGGQVHDVNILDELLPEAGAFYLLDRGYVDFARLYTFTQACAFFITRAKKNMQFYRRYSRPIERSTGLRCDQTILLTGVRTSQRYPDPLRRIHYFDAEKDSRLTFLTNNFLLPALTIAELYRARWQVVSFAKSLCTTLKGFLSHSRKPLGLGLQGTADPEAYRLYVKGLTYQDTLTADGWKRALEYFQKAVARDPNYAAAYAGMAHSYSWLGFFGEMPSGETRERAIGTATKAVQLDDSLSEAHAALGYAAMFNWDWKLSEKELRRALELNPSLAQAHLYYGQYLGYAGEIRRVRCRTQGRARA
jgi:tetratricopeptide (TPR) repeat protein